MIEQDELEAVVSVARFMVGRPECWIGSFDDPDLRQTWRDGQEIITDVKQHKPLTTATGRLELLARVSAWASLRGDEALPVDDGILLCAQVADGDGFARMLKRLISEASR